MLHRIQQFAVRCTATRSRRVQRGRTAVEAQAGNAVRICRLVEHRLLPLKQLGPQLLRQTIQRPSLHAPRIRNGSGARLSGSLRCELACSVGVAELSKHRGSATQGVVETMCTGLVTCPRAIGSVETPSARGDIHGLGCGFGRRLRVLQPPVVVAWALHVLLLQQRTPHAQPRLQLLLRSRAAVQPHEVFAVLLP